MRIKRIVSFFAAALLFAPLMAQNNGQLPEIDKPNAYVFDASLLITRKTSKTVYIQNFSGDKNVYVGLYIWDENSGAWLNGGGGAVSPAGRDYYSSFKTIVSLQHCRFIAIDAIGKTKNTIKCNFLIREIN